MKKKILLDVKGLRCPIPVLRAQKIIKKLNTGDILEVLTTDPKSIQDFKAFCKITNCLFQDFKKKVGMNFLCLLRAIQSVWVFFGKRCCSAY